MSPLVDGVAGWLATYLLHSTLLLLGAAAVTWRLADPAARERVWKLALVASVLTATTARLLPGELRPVFDLSRPAAVAGRVLDLSQPVDREPSAVISPPWGSSEHGAVAAVAAQPDGLGAAERAPDGAPAPASVWTRLAATGGWSLAVVGLWSLGGLLLLLRYGWATCRLHRRLSTRIGLREGVAVELLSGLCARPPATATPRLTVADDLSTPVVLGRHEICLPRRVAEELPEPELAAILAHELAHIRRGDLLWLRLCAAFECLLFVQPLNRLARRRLFEAVELLCDDWAGERTGGRLELAQGLATVARWAKSAPAPLPLPCLDGDRGPLLERVERLLTAPVAARRPALITAALAAVVVGLSCAGPGVRLEAQEAPPDLESLDLDALIALTEQVGARANERLLALPDDWRQRYAESLAVPGTRAVRILQRGRCELWPKRGGGAYYSFATEDHDYDREPDLSFAGDRLFTGFYGGTAGHILDLGTVPLADVRVDAAPPGLDAATAHAYSVMASFAAQRTDAMTAFQAELGTVKVGRAPAPATALAGHSYLLRAILPHEHDHLVAFHLEEASPDSVVLVWRVIRTWPVTEPRERSPRREWSYEGAGDWLLQLDDASLLRLRDSLASRVEQRLFEPPVAVAAEQHELAGLPDAGLTRLYQRGRFDFEWVVRGGGAYFSFVTRKHSYDHEPDLEWQRESFSSGFYGGNIGAFLDLGPTSLAALDTGRAPAGLTAEQRSVWELLQAQDLPEQADALSRVPVEMGHTYLLRSVLEDEHDVLAAFQPVQRDGRGMTIAWRVLQRFDG